VPRGDAAPQVKYPNNVIEADHAKLKQLIRPVRGFNRLKPAYATIKGVEVVRARAKGQAPAFNVTLDPRPSPHRRARFRPRRLCPGRGCPASRRPPHTEAT
jgi:hypothetical protein